MDQLPEPDGWLPPDFADRMYRIAHLPLDILLGAPAPGLSSQENANLQAELVELGRIIAAQIAASSPADGCC